MNNAGVGNILGEVKMAERGKMAELEKRDGRRSDHDCDAFVIDAVVVDRGFQKVGILLKPECMN